MVNVYVPKMASKMDELKPKTVFVTNRGGTHPNRLMYFDSIGADYQYVDFKVRWHGTSAAKWKMLLSGIICALTFPKRRKYKLFVTSDPQLPTVLMKFFFLLRKDQKIASYLGSQTLYFIYSGYYSKFTTFFYKFLLSKYDAHICNGNIQKMLLQKIINVPDQKVFVNFNGIRSDRDEKLRQVKYSPSHENLLFIGNLYSDWRIHYKGIDLLIEAFTILKKSKPKLTLTLIGNYDESLNELIHKIVPKNQRADVRVMGETNDLVAHLENAMLYIHPSRGDALPNSLLEALFSGIPVITSNLTGNFEIVSKIDSKLVCDINVASIVASVLHFYDLNMADKMKYSELAKDSCRDFTVDKAVKEFKSIIDEIIVR